MTDDLNAPLGVEPSPATTPRRFRPPLMPIAAGVVGVALLGIVGTVLLVRNPLGGEPRAFAAIAAPAPRGLERVETAAAPAAAAAAASDSRDDRQTINVIDGMSGTSREVRVAAAPDSDRSAGLDPRLAERGAQGPLPRIGGDGRKPYEAYARSFLAPTDQTASLPRVAILIGGLGISQNGTSEAISKLPGAISLAFAPYGPDLERVVTRARSEGHEVFLQIPMEPLDYPDNDPGPQTLLTTLSAERNTERLHWAMSRFQGYAGIVNYMGGKFTATENALLPVLKETAKRGLMVIDDGTSARSLVPQIAGALQQPSLRGDVHLDRLPTPAELDAQLNRLEARARERGFALGIGSALPVTIDRVAQWARSLEGRGVVLVPVTAGISKRAPTG
jgi:uncharacterized protein